MSELAVHFLPDTVPADVGTATAVVIDVLRATTTIVTALAHGAHAILPVADIETARVLVKQRPADQFVLGGERGGEKIDGFDLDNSPCNYSQTAVAGRQIVFTTSHGTQAIAKCQQAAQLLIASFANLAAVVSELETTSNDIHLVCSGTDSRPSIEDSLCAAVIAGQIWEHLGQPAWRDDTVLMLLEWYRQQTWADDAQRLQILTAGRGGQRLTRLHCQRDIEFAAQINRFNLVPRRDDSDGQTRIVA